jgi:hypothetical protein
VLGEAEVVIEPGAPVGVGPRLHPLLGTAPDVRLQQDLDAEGVGLLGGGEEGGVGFPYVFTAEAQVGLAAMEAERHQRDPVDAELLQFVQRLSGSVGAVRAAARICGGEAHPAMFRNGNLRRAPCKQGD